MAGALTQNSDARLKENISPMKNVLERVSGIPGVEFDWKDPKTRAAQGHQVGVIAQNLQKEFPELVLEIDNPNKESALKRILTVDYGHLSAVALQAVRELFEKWSADHKIAEIQSRDIASLKADNAAKAKEIEDLKARMDRLERSLPVK